MGQLIRNTVRMFSEPTVASQQINMIPRNSPEKDSTGTSDGKFKNRTILALGLRHSLKTHLFNKEILKLQITPENIISKQIRNVKHKFKMN